MPQIVNGSYYKGDVTITNRMADRYAVVNPPFEGKHRKAQDPTSVARRHARALAKKMRNRKETA